MMKRLKFFKWSIVCFVLLGLAMLETCYASPSSNLTAVAVNFPPELQRYRDARRSIRQRLSHRAAVNPFNFSRWNIN